MAPPGIQFAALDLIKQGLRMIGVLDSGEDPSGDEAGDSLASLNQMLDAWNAEKLAIFTTRIDDFALVANKQTYSLGAGGDFNLARPPRLESASIVLTSDPANPLELPIPIYTTEEWQERILLKKVQSTFPLMAYDDGAFPLRNLTFWPVPQETNTARLYSWQPLNLFPDLATQFTFPPGYAEAIKYSLAVRLAAEFPGIQMQPALPLLAQQAIARIKTINAVAVTLKCDDGVTSRQRGQQNYRAELFGIP